MNEIVKCSIHGAFLPKKNVSTSGDHWYYALEKQLEKFGVPRFDPTDTGEELRCPYCKEVLHKEGSVNDV